MMNKTLFAAAMLCTQLSQICCAQQKTEVKGHFDSFTADSVMVIYMGDTPRESHNVTLPAKGGDFVWTPAVDKATIAYIAAKPQQGERFGANGAAQVVVIPGETVTVSGTPLEETVSSPFNTALNAFMKPLEGKSDDEVAKAAADYIKANPSSLVSAYLVNCLVSDIDKTVEMIDAGVRNGVMSKLLDIFTAQAKQEAQRREASKNVQNGMPAPDFTLMDINGKELSLSSLRGKYVVLDFWGSWCIWCIRGIPKLKEYYAKYQDKMQILGIDCNDTEEKWRAAVKEHDIPWLHVYNPKSSELTKTYAIQGYPTKIVIDPKGNIVKTVVGEDPKFYDYLDGLFK